MYVCLVGTIRSIRNNHLKLFVDSFLQIWVPTPEKKVLTAVCTGGKGLPTRCKSMLFNMVVSKGFATRCKSLYIGTIVSNLKLTHVSHPRFTGTHYSLPSIEFTTFNIKYLGIPCMSSFCSQNILRIIDKVIRLQVFLEFEVVT